MIKREAVIGIFVFVIFSLSVSLVSAEVGVGISPSKISLGISSGEPYETEVIVFNTGDSSMDIALSVEGEIAKFTTFEPVIQTISPEPKPHALPLKNAKSFKVVFNPPNSFGEKIYSGSINAIGSPGEGAQFGGSVGVSTNVNLIVGKSSFYRGLFSKTTLIIIILLVVIGLVIWFIKRSGIHLEFGKQNQNKVKSKRRK